MNESGWQLRLDTLTQRELDILHLIADGLSNQDIAERLVITLGTAKWYTKQIYSKLQVSSRTQAIAAGRAAGLFDSMSAKSAKSNIEGPQHNLPRQPTPFLGRQEELATLTVKLVDPACRLLTLVGPGGIGKTRLAQQAAEEVVGQFAHGVMFVSLAPVSAASLLPSAIASALKVSFHSQATPNVQMLDYLRDKDMLLILDNFEHLLAGADFLVDLLGTAPRVKLLITSRERLSLQEEWLVQVQGIDYPAEEILDGLERYSAIQLFLQQAQRLQRGFSLALPADRTAVRRICQLVEGMPLGIELAATWLRAMSAPEIAERIAHDPDFLATSVRNVPERHKSIRALFEHSWHLLSAVERSVFMKLSVFRDGFRLEAAQQVAATSIAVLVALIDKSLVRPERDGRYDIHELLRQYAYDKLVEAGEADRVQSAHLDFYLQFAQQAKPMLEGVEQAMWLRRLDQDRNNFSAALRWSIESNAIGSGLQLGVALWLFWFMRGYLLEGRDNLQELLRAAGQTASASARAEALDKAGVLARYQGDYTHAFTLINEGLHLSRALGDKHGIANSLANLGFVALYQGDHARARLLYRESLEINRELSNRQGIADSLSHLALTAFFEGDYAEARSLDEESLGIWRMLGDMQGIAWALHLLGNVLLRDDVKSAYPVFAESLAISKDLGYQWGLALSLEDFAGLAVSYNEFEQALVLAGAATSLRKVIGLPLPPPEQAELSQRLDLARQALGNELAAAVWAEGQSMSIGQALAEISAMELNHPKA